jgi:hypothetical protein
MWKLLLAVAAIPLVVVGVVRLAVRILRLTRAHRGAVTMGLVIDELRGQFADALERWVEEPFSDHASFAEHGAPADHPAPAHDPGSHDH